MWSTPRRSSEASQASRTYSGRPLTPIQVPSGRRWLPNLVASTTWSRRVSGAPRPHEAREKELDCRFYLGVTTTSELLSKDDHSRKAVALMNVLGSRRWWALGALALALLVVGLDGTVLSIALPTLSTQLHASTGQLQWFVDAYLLVLAAVLLPAGLLGDRFGRKKLLLGALVVFGLASLACAYASTAGMLIAARSVLGLSAAFLMPLSMAVLPVLFTPEERPRALGIWVTASAASFPIGPIVGGWLLDNFWWGSVFLINVPVIVLGLIAVSLLVPESRDPHHARLDIVGALTSSLGLAGITYGFIEAGEKGWGSSTSLGAMAAGVVVLWHRWITRRPSGQPLVDLGLFRSASFTWGTILATVMNFALFGLLFAMPQYFQAVKGADALGTGLRLLPLIGGLVVGAR